MTLLPLLALTAIQTQTVAFTNVTVVPMDRKRVLTNQTVVVRNGRIAEIGDSARVVLDQSARKVDGTGKFLIPGLSDMHTHLMSDQKLPDELAGDELMLMVANGVTTIRLMIGTPEHLQYRQKINAGEMVGPDLYVASPEFAGRKYGNPFNGFAVTTPEEARQAVRDSKTAGYDYIKLTIFLKPEVYDAAIDEARKQQITVVGHVGQVGIHHAIEAGQHVEHLDMYMEALLKDDSPSKLSVSDTGIYRMERWATLDHVDDAKIPALAKLTSEAKIYSTPTLAFFRYAFAEHSDMDAVQRRPEFRFIPPKIAATMKESQDFFWKAPPSDSRRKRYQEVRNALVKAIHDAGGKIMAGSDTPEAFMLYGFGLHRELEALRDTGLTNYQVLASATRVPAEFVGKLKEFGTIEVGKRADLVLLNSNPLQDVKATQDRAGVMVRGRWLSSEELERTFDEIAARMSKAQIPD
jgi:hypothetical protein